MMFHRLFLTAAAIALPRAVMAQTVSGPYVSIGGGVDLLQNEIVHPYEGFGPSKRAFTFGPGEAGNAALGYRLDDGIRLEVAGDYAHSRLNGVDIATGVPGHAAGAQAQFGGFLNILYDFALGLPVSPYLGIGAGYQALELDHVSTGRVARPLGSSLTPEEGAFAYEGIAGFSYQLSAVPGLSLTAEYRMIGVTTPAAFQRGMDTVVESGVAHVSSATLGNIFNHEALVGLRYAFGGPPPSPAQPTAGSAALTVPPAVRTFLVFFDWDRADLSARARQIVAEAAAATHVQTIRIEVNGYTDLSGTPAYNQRLSVRRAESVEAELVRDGVARSEITLQGFGESRPLEHDPAICDQPADKHARQNNELERDASPSNDSTRSHPALAPTADGVREPHNRRVEIILN